MGCCLPILECDLKALCADCGYAALAHTVARNTTTHAEPEHGHDTNSAMRPEKKCTSFGLFLPPKRQKVMHAGGGAVGLAGGGLMAKVAMGGGR